LTHLVTWFGCALTLFLCRPIPPPVMDDLEEDLTCSVCYSLFCDPRVLPCSHTFCKACLDSILQSSFNQSIWPPDLPLKCPICRMLFALPPTGVEALPVNVSLRAIVEKAGGTVKHVKPRFTYNNACPLTTPSPVLPLSVPKGPASPPPLLPGPPGAASERLLCPGPQVDLWPVSHGGPAPGPQHRRPAVCLHQGTADACGTAGPTL